jgi:hypothetical protein
MAATRRQGQLSTFANFAKEGQMSFRKIKNEVTPAALRCSCGACQAVYRLHDGDLLIVGKKLDKELAQEIQSKVADDEYAIKISPEFFKDLFR